MSEVLIPVEVASAVDSVNDSVISVRVALEHHQPFIPAVPNFHALSLVCPEGRPVKGSLMEIPIKIPIITYSIDRNTCNGEWPSSCSSDVAFIAHRFFSFTFSVHLTQRHPIVPHFHHTPILRAARLRSSGSGTVRRRPTRRRSHDWD